jgi:hypothetical protein
VADWIEPAHRALGYPIAFVVAPAALLAFTVPRIHRRWGRAYFYGMTVLYLSGTYLTLTRHDWHTWHFARNVSFNFLGFSMILYAYRAIWLFRRTEAPRPSALDWALSTLQLATVVAVVSVAVFKDTPMRVFALVGLVLCALDLRDLRAAFQPRPRLFRRHVRYVLASYYYLLTLVSIVHLDRVLPRNVKWLWPTVVAAVALGIAFGGRQEAGRGGLPRPLSRAVTLTLLVAGLLAAWVVVQLLSGARIAPQSYLETGCWLVA